MAGGFGEAMAMRRRTGWMAVWLALPLWLAGCASGGKQMSALDQAQYDWSEAVRWGNFEGAEAMVAPEIRERSPLTGLQIERYKQIRVSAYRDLAATIAPDNSSAAREILIGITNRNTMVDRELRYTETWRYDAAAQRWWVTSGLPDFWQGE